MAKARAVKNIKCEAPVIENARRIIMVRLEELLSWTPYIDDPVNVPEIHHMRIAAKRLRYTLELFRPILGKGTKELIDEIKAIQAAIGTMHDADVMIERVVAMITADGEERMSRMMDIATATDRGTVPQRRQRMRSAAVARHTVRDEVALYTLVAQHAEHSVESYHEFIRTWGVMMETDFVGRLRQHIGVDPPPPTPEPVPKSKPAKAKAETVAAPEPPDGPDTSATSGAAAEAEDATGADPELDHDDATEVDADDAVDTDADADLDTVTDTDTDTDRAPAGDTPEDEA